MSPLVERWVIPALIVLEALSVVAAMVTYLQLRLRGEAIDAPHPGWKPDFLVFWPWMFSPPSWILADARARTLLTRMRCAMAVFAGTIVAVIVLAALTSASS